MTFLEALKTGKPLRRKAWWRRAPGGPGDRYLVMDDDGVWTWNDGTECAPPDRCEYFSDDWEVAP